MLIPGLINELPTVTALTRVSPSRFQGLKECALREILTSSRVPAYLPSIAAARLGGVIHKFLEGAGKGKIAGSEKELTVQWENLVSEQESRLQKDWLDSACVPLSKTVRDYDIRRLRAIRKAVQIASSRAFHLQGVSAVQNESWVQTSDGLIGGAIDCVVVTENGAILRDYKSGQIYDGAQIKPDYKTQMKLYAALYAAVNGYWPSGLEIEPLNGDNVSVPFSQSECNSLLSEALNELERVNKVVSTLGGKNTLSSEMVELANPQAKTCSFCRYRPVCGPYLSECRASSEEKWPVDVWGEIKASRKLHNGKLLLELSNGLETYFIRGVTDDPARHPALPFFQDGMIIFAFNLLRTQATTTFSEVPQTVIYCRQQGAFD